MEYNQLFQAQPYLPGSAPAQPGPLARFLSPIPKGVARQWLTAALNLPQTPAPWVLDPFGVAPELPVEAARAGCRVLVAANNPIARFLIEQYAQPPSKQDLTSTLAELAGSFKGSERIEPHIRNLYRSQCRTCFRGVEVEAFLWERQASAPYACLFTCPHCGASGEFPASSADIERATQFNMSGLHHARALERVAAADDPDRAHVAEALEVYLPRAIYALFTLLNKLDSLSLSRSKRDQLAALLLNACDQSNTLWAHPGGRERPRQLSSPPRFRENNVWLALEQAVDLWAFSNHNPPLCTWPQIPPETGGICLYEGRLKDFIEDIQKNMGSQIQLEAVLTPLPRPNQAYWTLSALWAGWLWGRQAVGPFKSVLRRRRYDWAWHTTALTAALESLAPVLSRGTPLLVLTGEAETGLLTAIASAADVAGFDIEGISLRGEQAQLYFQRASNNPIRLIAPQEYAQLAEKGAQTFLRAFGQPASYLPVYTAALLNLTYHHAPRTAGQQGTTLQREDSQALPAQPKLTLAKSGKGSEAASPTEIFNTLQGNIRQALTYRGGLLRYGTSESPETGHYWLQNPADASVPLIDQIEIAVVNFLIRQPGSSQQEIEKMLFENFPGLLTPESEWVQMILESYAVHSQANLGKWQLRVEDAPAARRQDLSEIQGQLRKLASQLGYVFQEGQPSAWLDANQSPVYWFYPIASAVIGEILLKSNLLHASDPQRHWIVLPGGRANLVAYKLRRDPRLRGLCQLDAQEENSGWGFLKFRHVRWLLENPTLNPDNFATLLPLDPLTYSAPQMRLL